MTIAGREVLVHQAPGLKGPAPLVLVMHGVNGSDHLMQNDSQMDAEVDRRMAVAAYPNAAGSRWNQAPEILGSTPDDIDVIQQVVARLVDIGCADPARIYLAGLSNGGGMAYRMACDSSLKLAAIALVSADYLGISTCKHLNAVATIAFHGTADELIPLAGVTVGKLVHPPVGKSIREWAAANGCRGEATPSMEGANHVAAWTDCPHSADVVLHVVEGGGHVWYTRTGDVGVDADKLIWDFFDAHRGSG